MKRLDPTRALIALIRVIGGIAVASGSGTANKPSPASFSVTRTLTVR